ncbi:MAG: Co2+/Mg2+ efflux protein ApaG [Crocinitomicaceae bacterium]|nr:Co2+/Mg2+ efflux protein ApaG [Flavobacteriales bacterium]NQZ37334.1 Co2+/Mg2+ efflux protein ApaG [Crocinitomicaceae bacterium]PHR22855.1 MAG: Co2+/Mg2+ efflux protein ApaG [Fluviicola sp.]
MNTLTTSGVQISIKTSFRTDLSEVLESRYFFNYRVEIQNTNSFVVQLQSRDWYIFDSLGEAKYVSGSGVVGEQPILKSGETFVYSSGCELSAEIGMMKGFYTFINMQDGELFEVTVPTFKLEYPPKLN